MKTDASKKQDESLWLHHLDAFGTIFFGEKNEGGLSWSF